MKNSERFFQALKTNNGQLNEIEVGDSIGLNEDESRRAIAELLAESKISYAVHRACNYKIAKAGKRGQKKR